MQGASCQRPENMGVHWCKGAGANALLPAALVAAVHGREQLLRVGGELQGVQALQVGVLAAAARRSGGGTMRATAAAAAAAATAEALRQAPRRGLDEGRAGVGTAAAVERGRVTP